MKKKFMFLILAIGFTFSCQQESVIPKSDDWVSAELVNDQDFKDFFKNFEALIVKSKNVDPSLLDKLKTSTNEAEIKAILKFIDVEDNMDYLITKAISLKQRYGNGINENVLKMALNSSDGKLFNINDHSKIESNLVRLRTARLPCSKTFDDQLAAIGAGYLTALVSCGGTTAAYLVCAGLATTAAIIAVNLAEDAWDSCMADIYNHSEP